MKILCLNLLLSLTCFSPCISSSVQVHRFMSQKALTKMPDGNALNALHRATEANAKKDEPKKKEKKTESADAKTGTGVWSGVSNVNLEFTLAAATLWVLVLGSAPILIYYSGDKPVTKSAVVLSCLMWMALFGGLYLFTQIILFNSPHFDRVRSLTIIECTYFMTQVITTVGYGDITPAHSRGQVFVGLYVTLSFFVIALLMAEMQSVVMEKVNKYKDRLKQKVTERVRSRGYMAHSNDLTHSASSIIGFKPEKPSTHGLVASVSVFAGIAFIWILFFHYYPGENKSWLEAVYMSLITLTTVGFGAVTPMTEAGMLFAAFFMFIGTSALVNVVQNFSTYILEFDQYESWCPKEFEAGLKQFLEKHASEGGNAISEEKFLILALMQKKLVTEDQIDAIKGSYKSMLGSSGKLNLKGIARQVSQDIDHAELGDSDTEAATTARDSARSVI